MDLNQLGVVTLKLLEGFKFNFIIFAVTLLASLPLGLILSFGSMSKVKPIAWVTKIFIWIIRGTPLMLQIMLVFFGPGLLWHGESLSRLNAALVAFVVNYACYFSEIFRGGIESIPKGQYEAGQVLGMTKTQIFFKVVLMQVIKRIVPPTFNEIMTLIKDTSLARIISVVEITRVANNFITSNALIWPLFYSGVFYLVFCGILTVLSGAIEKKLNYYKG